MHDWILSFLQLHSHWYFSHIHLLASIYVNGGWQILTQRKTNSLRIAEVTLYQYHTSSFSIPSQRCNYADSKLFCTFSVEKELVLYLVTHCVYTSRDENMTSTVVSRKSAYFNLEETLHVSRYNTWCCMTYYSRASSVSSQWSGKIFDWKGERICAIW